MQPPIQVTNVRSYGFVTPAWVVVLGALVAVLALLALRRYRRRGRG